MLFYVRSLFPYGLNLLVPFEGLFSIYKVKPNDVGLFIYFVLVFAIYILFKKDKETYFLTAFASICMLYLEFGTMSLTHYYLMYRLTRFTVIISIPLMLILARGIALFAKNKNKIRVLIAFAILAMLFATALPIEYFWYQLNHNSMMFSELIAKDLESAPNISNSYVYAPTLLPGFIHGV